MRIGLIISELRNGGGPYQLLHLAWGLERGGHDVTIYALRGSISNVEPRLIKGLRIKSCHFTNQVEKRPHSQIIGFTLYLIYLFKITYTLYSLIRKDKLDILNPHEWPMHWAAVLVKLRKKIPVVWMCNDVWQIAVYKHSENRIVFKLGDRIIAPFIDKLFTLFVNRIVVLDRRIYNIIQSYYHKKPILVRSGVDLENFKTLPSQNTARANLGIPTDAFVFLCFSIFFSHRRFEDAILAFNQLLKKTNNRKMLLIIAGSDAYEKSYTSKINNLIIDLKLQEKVIIRTGYFSTDEKKSFLSACDVFVFPNEKQTWGLIVTEAMAAGKPCIVSDEAGVHEIIEHEKNGLIFQVRNVNDLASKMAALLEDRELCERLGKEARSYVFKNLSWERYTTQMTEAFRAVIK